MSIKSDIKLTSVKIVKDVYNQFKHVSLDDNINLSDFNQTSANDVLKYESIEDIIKHVVTSKIKIEIRGNVISLVEQYD